MKYKLKSNMEGTVLEDVLRNRGINSNDIEEFLHPKRNVIQEPTLYKNMDKALECLVKHINNKSRILIVVDSDADGFCSNAMLYSYLLKTFDLDGQVEYIVHSTKSHGFTNEIMETIYEEKYELVLMADAGSSDYERHKELHQMGVDIVIIDHHECDRYSDHAIVINNQLEESTNKTLSGGGVVMKFLEYVDSMFNVNNAMYYSDLCAIAMVSDSMLMNELETRYYVQLGVNNINNEFLFELLKKKTSVGYTDISYSVAPVINAIIRVAEQQDKEYLFEVLVGVNREMVLNIRGKGDVEMNLSEYVIKISDRCKRLQTKLINDLMENKDFKIYSNNLPIVIGIVPSDFNANLSGLIANKIADSYMRPSIVLKLNSEGTKYTGSGRSSKEVKNFKDFLVESNLFAHCEGHQSAFGLSLEVNKLDTLIKYLETKELTKEEECYEVDRVYNNNTINAYDIMSIAQLDKHWSKGFEKPIFFIKLENIKSSDIDIVGKNKDTIRIKHKGITFVKFKCDTFELVKTRCNSNFNIEIIGEFSLNEWNNNTYPQVIVKNMEIEEITSTDVVDNPFMF